jgi:hypothetical protein
MSYRYLNVSSPIPSSSFIKDGGGANSACPWTSPVLPTQLFGAKVNLLYRYSFVEPNSPLEADTKRSPFMSAKILAFNENKVPSQSREVFSSVARGFAPHGSCVRQDLTGTS